MNKSNEWNSQYYDFVCDAYSNFLIANDDKVTELEDELKNKLDESIRQSKSELEAAITEKQELQDRLNTLSRSGMKIQELKKRNHELFEDKAKMEEYIEQYSKKIDEKQKDLTLLENEEKQLNDKKEELIKEIRELEQQIRVQKFSPQDILNMKKEKMMLTESYNQAINDQNTLKATRFENKSILNENINKLKSSIREYNDLCAELLLIPTTAANANGNDLSIEFRDDLLESGIPYTNDTKLIKEYLKQFKQYLVNESEEYNNEIMKLDDIYESKQKKLKSLKICFEQTKQQYQKLLENSDKEESMLKSILEGLDHQIKETIDEIEEFERKAANIDEEIANEYEAVNKLREHIEIQRVKNENELREFSNIVLQNLEILSSHKEHIQVYLI